MTTLQTLGQQSLFALEMMAVLAGALRQRMDPTGNAWVVKAADAHRG